VLRFSHACPIFSCKVVIVRIFLDTN